MVNDGKSEKYEKKDSSLEKLKLKYEEVRKKYNLPEFRELNILFDIEDVDPDTDMLLRGIRRAQVERVAGYLRFIEMLLNPGSGPMFFFKLVKDLSSGDRENLTKVYESLNMMEVENLKFDFEYSEEKEAVFIKKLHRAVLDNKDSLLGVIDKLSISKTDVGDGKKSSYFG